MSSGVYLCHLCEKSFKTKKECVEHTSSHYTNPQAAGPSPNIPTSTTSTEEAEAMDIVPPLSNISDEEILAKLIERNYAFICKCGIIFRDQALFYLHRGTHSTHDPKECSFCGHVAPNWYDFMSHFYVHSNKQVS